MTARRSSAWIWDQVCSSAGCTGVVDRLLVGLRGGGMEGPCGPGGRRIYQRRPGVLRTLDGPPRGVRKSREKGRASPCEEPVHICRTCGQAVQNRGRVAGTRASRVYWPSPTATLGRRSRPWPAEAIPRRSSHETHLPTEEAQARSHARVPRPDADARRSSDAQASPRQGPQAPHRPMRAARASRLGEASAGGSPAAPSSTGSSGRDARTRTASWSSTASRARTRLRRRAPPWPFRLPQSRRRRRAQSRQAVAARGIRAGGERLPPGHDVVDRRAARGAPCRRARRARGYALGELMDQLRARVEGEGR